jgi:hypothetical protein
VSYTNYRQHPKKREESDVTSDIPAGFSRGINNGHREIDPEQRAGMQAEQIVGGIPLHDAYLSSA